MKHDSTNLFPELVRKLIGILKRQETEIGSVATALKAERCSFVSAHGSVHKDANERLEARSSQCMALEEERVEVLRQIADFLGVPSPRLTARRISAALSSPMGKTLEQQAHATKEAAGKLQIETRVGATLLEWSASCHENLLHRLTEASQTHTTYERNGRQNENQNQARLLDATL